MAESSSSCQVSTVTKELQRTTQLPVKLQDVLLLQRKTFKQKWSQPGIPAELSDSSDDDDDDDDYNSTDSSESSESSTSSLCLPPPQRDSESSEETDSSDCSDSSDNSNSSSDSDVEDLIKRIKSNRMHIEDLNKGILNKNNPDVRNNLPFFNKKVDTLLQNNNAN
ncbi:dentin sialophosphoprotein-like [Argonauta hians]